MGLGLETCLVSESGIASKVFTSLLNTPLSDNCAMHCSFFSLGTNINDLIQDYDENRGYYIREDPEGFVLVENLSEYKVESTADLNFLIHRGRKRLG